MAKAVRGTKRRCPHCGAPFYDLNRHPITCPKCHEEVKPEALTKVPIRSGSRSASRPVVVPEPVVEDVENAEAFEEDEVLSQDESGDEDIVPEDGLEEDQDDMRE